MSRDVERLRDCRQNNGWARKSDVSVRSRKAAC